MYLRHGKEDARFMQQYLDHPSLKKAIPKHSLVGSPDKTSDNRKQSKSQKFLNSGTAAKKSSGIAGIYAMPFDHWSAELPSELKWPTSSFSDYWPHT
ncbi:hypothetical protein Tco_1177344 [Tanacetum coccineum]